MQTIEHSPAPDWNSDDINIVFLQPHFFADEQLRMNLKMFF